MKLLITGTTGFVGKNFLKALANTNHKIKILTRKPISNHSSFVGDLNNKKILSAATQDVDVVVHIAGISKGPVFKVNYEGTKNLVDVSLQNKVRKFIYISSFDATLPTKYGRSKLRAENYLKKSGLGYLILRPAVIYGPENNKNLDRLIILIKKSPLIPIPGNGNVKLQPLFVNDLTDLILQGIQNNTKNKTYFIGGPNALSFNEVVSIISKHFSKKVSKIHIPKLLLRFTNKSLLENKIGDLTEIKKDFRFNPKTLEEGLNLI